MREILRLQWSSYWRKVSRGGSAAKNNLIVLALIAIGLSARYVSILKLVMAQTRKGQFLELDLLAAAIFVVCVSSLWEAGNSGMGPRELARFPLTMRERLTAQIWGGLVSPVCWLAALLCFGLFLPLAVSPNPVCAIIAGLAFFRASFMTGISARHFLATATGRKFGPIAVGALLAGGALMWLRFGRESTLALNFLPSHLLILAAQGSWLSAGVLVALAVGASVLARHSLTWMLERAPATVSRNAVSSASISVLQKDLRYFRQMETLAWLILAGLAFYLATADAPEADAVRAVLAFTSLLSVGTAMNCFGPDGPWGLDRYGLWPLGGRTIIGTKNGAVAILTAARCAPVLVLACWRFGWREGMYDTVEAGALLLGSMAWGNVTSVRSPYVGEEASSLIDQLIGLAASALPGALTIGILRGGGDGVPYAMFGMLALCGGAYAVSLRWASGYYSRRFSEMHERMS